MDIKTIYSSMLKQAAGPFTQVDASKQLGPISIEPAAAPAQAAPAAPAAPKEPPSEEQLQEDALGVIEKGVTAAKGVIDRNKPQQPAVADAAAGAGVPPEAGLPVEGQMTAVAKAGLNPKDEKFCAGLSLLARLIP